MTNFSILKIPIFKHIRQEVGQGRCDKEHWATK